MDDTSQGGLLIIGISLFVLLLFNPTEWWTSDRTVYSVYCQDYNKSVTDCPSNKKTYSSAIYTTIIEPQTVLITRSTYITNVGKKCKVKDRNNWTCTDEIYKNKLHVMFNGEFHIESFANIKSVEYSPKYGWFLSNPIKAIKVMWND